MSVCEAPQIGQQDAGPLPEGDTLEEMGGGIAGCAASCLPCLKQLRTCSQAKCPMSMFVRMYKAHGGV